MFRKSKPGIRKVVHAGETRAIFHLFFKFKTRLKI